MTSPTPAPPEQTKAPTVGTTDNGDNRRKDPKKVAAGKAGAAARKAKQQKLLDELRQAKAALRPDETHATVDIGRCQAEPVQKAHDTASGHDSASGHDIVQSEPEHSAVPTAHTCFPWIIGGIGFVAVIWVLSTQRKAVGDADNRCSSASASPKGGAAAIAGDTAATRPHPQTNHHLKQTADPFHME